MIATRCVTEPDVAIPQMSQILTRDDFNFLAITFDGCTGLARILHHSKARRRASFWRGFGPIQALSKNHIFGQEWPNRVTLPHTLPPSPPTPSYLKGGVPRLRTAILSPIIKNMSIPHAVFHEAARGEAVFGKLIVAVERVHALRFAR